MFPASHYPAGQPIQSGQLGRSKPPSQPGQLGQPRPLDQLRQQSGQPIQHKQPIPHEQPGPNGQCVQHGQPATQHFHPLYFQPSPGHHQQIHALPPSGVTGNSSCACLHPSTSVWNSTWPNHQSNSSTVVNETTAHPISLEDTNSFNPVPNQHEFLDGEDSPPSHSEKRTPIEKDEIQA